MKKNSNYSREFLSIHASEMVTRGKVLEVEVVVLFESTQHHKPLAFMHHTKLYLKKLMIKTKS